MTSNLSHQFAVLTDDRPEPPDPAALVRTGITRTRRRRTAAGVLGTAAITAIALAAAPFAGALMRADVPAAGEQASAVAPGQRLPDPWLNKPVPAVSGAYYIAEGKVGAVAWNAVVTRKGCVSFTQPDSSTVIGPLPRLIIVDPLPTAPPACSSSGLDRYVTRAQGSKQTIVLAMGVTSADARKVRITEGKRSFTVDAVATPASNSHRYFAIAYAGPLSGAVTFRAFDADGRPIPS
ncbi:hypothetical protein ACI2LF_16510 [Kribbella sp. NPDC020789]